MKASILSVAAVALLAGCATSDEPRAPRVDKGDVMIGSHLPRKDPDASGVTILGREAVERQQSGGGGPIGKGSENPR